MPVRPSLVERLAFRLDLAPAMMLDYLGGQGFRALAAAQRLGLFAALGEGPLPVAELARRLGAEPRGLALLVRALRELGYLKEQGGRVAPTAMAARWLPVLGEGIELFDLILDRLGHLDETIRRGGPATPARDWLDARPGRWRAFQHGMIALARLAGDEVTARLRLPAGARRLIDIGGGHGLYSILLCRRYPGLTATVYDLPEALDSARELVAAERMSERVSLQPGDLWAGELGQGYDVALLFNMIHGNRPEQNRELLHKTAAALTATGQVVILDQLAGGGGGRTARAVAALNGLTLFELNGGQTYSAAEVGAWLAAAGFARPRRIRLRSSPGSSLLIASASARLARAAAA